MRYDELSSIFPKFLKEVLEELKMDIRNLQEMRIRVEQPVLVRCGNREYQSAAVMKTEQVREILVYLSNYSLYAYEEEVRRGFLTLPGGHRVGIAGRTILEGGKVRTIKDVSSLNIRFAHEVKGCADKLLPYLRNGKTLLHTLIASAPGHGKTTLLRDCVRQISDGDTAHPGMAVGVVDERSEIAGSFRGIPGNDIGMRTDVLDGCPKAEGMLMLIRSMAPQVVAVDEVGSREDLAALASAMNCGCVLLATVHGSSMEELKSRPVLKELVEMRLFERYVFLEGMGQVRQILGQMEKPVAMGGTGC